MSQTQKGVRRRLGGQAGLQPRQGVPALGAPAEGGVPLVVDGLDDLADAGQPAAQRLGLALAAVARGG
ncbi:MAG TPA: hypothetical protein VG370_28490, partial [Chloroflexota bacterium]|nr:hypothetical protein [Chloroflexota bacterium]